MVERKLEYTEKESYDTQTKASSATGVHGRPPPRPKSMQTARRRPTTDKGQGSGLPTPRRQTLLQGTP